jgi:predicted CopG family antitoxin
MNCEEHAMAVKTITIDMEAYDLLAADKREGESFSKVIKRNFKSEDSTARALLERVRRCTVSSETLDRIEEVYQSRAEYLAESPSLDGEE